MRGVFDYHQGSERMRMRSPTNRPQSYLGIQFVMLALTAIYVISTIGLVLLGLYLRSWAVAALAVVQFASGVAFVIYSNREY